MSSKALELRDIRKAFGDVEVIHGIDLDIEEGEFVVFVGPSGCGKSTLLRLIAGLDDPTSGDILLNDKRVNGVPASERGLSMVFQSYALYPHMSVRKNLSFGLENLRVAIGRAIVREPVIFLFDEPLSNLDAELRLQMRVEISQLHAQLENTMIYVTHDQVEAMTMADRIVILRDGRVEQIGRPLDLYNRPVNKFVAGFIGAPKMNFLNGQLDGNTVALDCGMTRSFPFYAQETGAVSVGVRPEAIGVSLDNQGDASVTVKNFEQLGAITYIYTEFDNGETLTVQLPELCRGRGDSIKLVHWNR